MSQFPTVRFVYPGQERGQRGGYTGPQYYRAEELKFQAEKAREQQERQAAIDAATRQQQNEALNRRTAAGQIGGIVMSGRDLPPGYVDSMSKLLGITPSGTGSGQSASDRAQASADVLTKSRIANKQVDAAHAQQVQAENASREANGAAPYTPTIGVQATADSPYRVVQGSAAQTAGGAMGQAGAYDWRTSPNGEVAQRTADMNAAKGNFARALDVGANAPTIERTGANYEAMAAARAAAMEDQGRLMAQGPPQVPGMETYAPGARQPTTTEATTVHNPRLSEPDANGQVVTEGQDVNYQRLQRAVGPDWSIRFRAASQGAQTAKTPENKAYWASQLAALKQEFDTALPNPNDQAAYFRTNKSAGGAPDWLKNSGVGMAADAWMRGPREALGTNAAPTPSELQANFPSISQGPGAGAAGPSGLPPPPVNPWEAMTYPERLAWNRANDARNVTTTEANLSKEMAAQKAMPTAGGNALAFGAPAPAAGATGSGNALYAKYLAEQGRLAPEQRPAALKVVLDQIATGPAMAAKSLVSFGGSQPADVVNSLKQSIAGLPPEIADQVKGRVYNAMTAETNGAPGQPADVMKQGRARQLAMELSRSGMAPGAVGSGPAGVGSVAGSPQPAHQKEFDSLVHPLMDMVKTQVGMNGLRDEGYVDEPLKAAPAARTRVIASLLTQGLTPAQIGDLAWNSVMSSDLWKTRPTNTAFSPDNGPFRWQDSVHSKESVAAKFKNMVIAEAMNSQ